VLSVANKLKMSAGTIIAPSDLSDFREKLRSRNSVLIFTNGVFDLLHPGHVQYLSDAKELGTHLIVALNSDTSTRKIKGGKRPLVPLEQRLEVLSALESVDFLTWFEEETPAEVIRVVQPDVLVKGGDWQVDQIVGKDFVESYGGKVLNIPFIPGYSTSAIIERIRRLKI